MAAEKTTMKVNIVAADHPVWHGEATSVTIPASEGGMGILPDHEPVLTVIKQGTLTVVEPDGDRHMFEVTDGVREFHPHQRYDEQTHRGGRARPRRPVLRHRRVT